MVHEMLLCRRCFQILSQFFFKTQRAQSLPPLKTNISPKNRWLEHEISFSKWSLFRGHSFLFWRFRGTLFVRKKCGPNPGTLNPLKSAHRRYVEDFEHNLGHPFPIRLERAGIFMTFFRRVDDAL